MLRVTVLVIGAFCACAIAYGRHIFGISGSTFPWYLFGIALPYLLLSILLTWQLGGLARSAAKLGRSVLVWLLIAWVCAIGFALTAPDKQADGTLAAIAAQPGSSHFALDMAIAFSNPFAIISFAGIIGANIVAYAKYRAVNNQQ